MTRDEESRAQVLRRAQDVFGSAEVATRWYDNEPLREFGGRTAAQAVAQGRTDAVLRLLDLVEGGFLG